MWTRGEEGVKLLSRVTEITAGRMRWYQISWVKHESKRDREVGLAIRKGEMQRQRLWSVPGMKTKTRVSLSELAGLS